MDEIINALNQIAEILKGDWISTVGSIVSIIVPIGLTILSIILTVRIDKRNEKLQKIISNRDTQNQTRQIIIDIYNAYLEAFYYVANVKNAVADTFISDKSYYKFAVEIEQRHSNITYAYNKAKLVLDDKELIDVLGKGLSSFSEIKNVTESYITLGLANQTIINAWNAFSTNHPQIQLGDYIPLFQNPVLGDEFRKMCTNSYTENVKAAIEDFISIVECDEFDDKFKKYVKIEKIKED